MKRGAAAALAAALGGSISLAACDGLFVQPTVSSAPAVGFELTASVLSPQIAAVFAKVERVRVTLTKPSGQSRDTIVVLERDSGTGRAQVRLEPQELTAGLQIGADLVPKTLGFPLFRGSATLDPAHLPPTITVVPVPAQITVSASSLLFDALGDIGTVTAVVRFANGDPFPGAVATFTADNPRVIEVTPDGKVTAKGNGVSAATASFRGVLGSATLRVQQVAAQLAIVQDSATIVSGGETRLTVTGKDRNGYGLADAPITWRSSNTAVATVGTDGVVLGVREGTVQITATSGSQSSTRTVRVLLGITLPNASLVWTRPEGLAVGDQTGANRLIRAFEARQPAWSPDHTQILYVVDDRLYVVDAAGTTSRRIAASLPHARAAEFSVDGAWIYFSGQGTSGGDHVYRIHPDDSGLQLLTDDGLGGTFPTTSPDGQRFAYSGLDRANGSSSVIVQTIGGARQAIAVGEQPVSLRWSPDGQWIAYLRQLKGELWVIRPDGTGAHRLATLHGFNEGISWSPDGAWIVGTEATTSFINFASGALYDVSWSGSNRGISWWR